MAYEENEDFTRSLLSSLNGKKIASAEYASGHAIFKDARGRVMFEVDLSHLFDADGNWFDPS